MDADPPYKCQVNVFGESGTYVAEFAITFDHEANALRLFDFIMAQVANNYTATRRAETETPCPTDQPASS